MTCNELMANVPVLPPPPCLWCQLAVALAALVELTLWTKCVILHLSLFNLGMFVLAHQSALGIKGGWDLASSLLSSKCFSDSYTGQSPVEKATCTMFLQTAWKLPNLNMVNTVGHFWAGNGFLLERKAFLSVVPNISNESECLLSIFSMPCAVLRVLHGLFHLSSFSPSSFLHMRKLRLGESEYHAHGHRSVTWWGGDRRTPVRRFLLTALGCLLAHTTLTTARLGGPLY